MSDRTSAAFTPVNACTAVVGLQWGDEGKGKLVDLLAPEHDAVVRYNGGANAGHSVVFDGKRHALHLVPSGVFHPGALAVIGNGVVVDPAKLIEELDLLIEKGVDVSGLRVSDRAHVVMPYHMAEDGAREQVLSGKVDGAGVGQSIGTTKRGIGPAYADKVQRAAAVRIGDLLRPDRLREKLELACAFHNHTLSGLGDDAPRFDPGEMHMRCLDHGERLREHIVDTLYLLHDMLAGGKRLLFEGANGTLLDVDHGTYPFVTSSNSCVLGIGPGSGVTERRLGRVIGIAKAYCTRVGAGPFPTELHDQTGERIRKRGNEFGTTTGRPRRTGWLDLVALRYGAMLNGCTEMMVTLLDVLAGFEELHICTAYRIGGETTDRFPPDAADLERAEPVYESVPGFADEIVKARKRADLPGAAIAYIERIESFTGVPVRAVGVGPDREQTIQM
ncbi:MAG: adenylosuccinate synthase [Phycisphaeraceae bacterium]|nr:MAG: adenylosuccinate synthase [Phycisphaeraceae bacterium]